MSEVVVRLSKCRRRPVPRAGGRRGVCRKKQRKLRPSRRLRVYYYYAQGDGVKRSFREEDAIPGYTSRIPHKGKMLLANVFVDGMLQAPELYRTNQGELHFLSDQPPPPDSRIIAQFIVIRP